MKQAFKPSARLLYALAALAGIALLLDASATLGHPVPTLVTRLLYGAFLALAGLALIDLLKLKRRPSPGLRRYLPGSMALGRWSDIRLDVTHDFPGDVTIRVIDHPPSGMETENLPQSGRLMPGRSTHLSYRVRPVQRGPFTFEHCEVHVSSPLRLWTARRYLPLVDRTRVYPDFARVYGGQLLAMDNWLGQMGVRQHQRRGLGLEFNQLREFREGDSLRQIDWKATARQRTPIAREYQDERDQQIVFLLDCGRRMRSQDGDLSHFHHALNACLLLSYIALRQGDAVGLSTFATDQERYLSPVKGQSQLHPLLNMVYDLESTRRPADYALAVRQLLARQKKRALVVLVTNLRDEEDEELLGAVKQLSRQHRVLIANLREQMLDGVRQSPVRNYDQALTYCGTVDVLNARAQLHDRLIAQGVPVLDSDPAGLGPKLVTRYLSWKKAGTL
ncbi:DUF58 domain-containing protein [Pseudomonas sp. R1-18]|uniref:DUF58 domain-containing protein n=1 Tax=Pseudomonas sp. R1-18 TaxID=1632772 RepID=UPI003DAA1953